MSALADVIVDRLRAVGSRAIFGVPGGGGNLDLIEAARGIGLPFILTATETGAAIAAMAQAEVTGRPGACLTTLGPGAASAVNGVACALLDRAPIVVFTDSQALGARGRFTHQELDQLALFAPITKWSGRLTSEDAIATLERAFTEVIGLPPGPVHLDCPGNVSGIEAPLADTAAATDVPARAMDTALDERIAHARKPLLLIGLGARHTADAAAIRGLCERRQVPAMVTYKAKGVVPDAHTCFAGVFTNGAIERSLIEQSDLLIGVGLDPVELLPRPWMFTPPIVGVGRWRVPADHVPFATQWVTDVASAASMIEERIGPSDWDLDAVAEMMREQRRQLDIPTDGTGGIPAQRVIDVAAEALSATSRVTVDAGAHMLPATMRWPVSDPNGLLISNGLSTMGFALPAAIGAALADRDRAQTGAGAVKGHVVAITGDGGLLMCAGELLTAVREQLRIIVIVFSDTSLSLIEIKQQARRLPPAGVALGVVNWMALAESFGVAGFAASSEDDLARAIDQAVGVDGPSLIDARVDPSNYGDMLKVIRG